MALADASSIFQLGRPAPREDASVGSFFGERLSLAHSHEALGRSRRDVEALAIIFDCCARQVDNWTIELFFSGARVADRS